MLDDDVRLNKIIQLGQNLRLPSRFLDAETECAMGRYLPQDIDQYVTCRREGRGRTPQMPGQLRTRLVNDVIAPYTEWMTANGHRDWNDLAVEMTQIEPPVRYDVAIVDESQDFSGGTRSAP